VIGLGFARAYSIKYFTVLVFIDIYGEGGARDIDIDLVGDGEDAPADNLDADGIERVWLASAPYGGPATITRRCAAC
jgi:hypothetical protein